MGDFYIGFDRADGLPGLRKNAAIADADIDRVARAHGGLYFPNGIEVSPGDPTAVPPIPPEVRPPTGDEIFDAMARGILDGILANTVNWEKGQAAKEAADNIPPIPVVVDAEA